MLKGIFINARPNLNGNSVQDFMSATDKLEDNITTMEETLYEIRGTLFHGRNYQTVDDPVADRQDDLDKVNKLIGLLELYNNFAVLMRLSSTKSKR